MKALDCIVIGAGPAGCIAAALLKSSGYDVRVFERSDSDKRKVCGDGLSSRAICELESIGFPIENFVAEGARRIDSIYHCRDGNIDHFDMKRTLYPAYTLARNKTDAVFREYCQQRGAEIIYNMPVWEINQCDVGFRIADYTAKNVIVACGAGASPLLSGKRLIPCADYPVGCSMIIKGERTSEMYYHFEYRPEYKGTYGWVFTLDDNLYNVGLWLKKNPAKLRAYFGEFCAETVQKLCGEYSEVLPFRGACMGIGNPVVSSCEGIYIIGDAANSSCPEDGEGISNAVTSAKRCVEYILAKRDKA